MPKWKKDETEFTVGVNFHKIRGYQTSIPRPIIERLGNPSKICFLIRGKKIEIVAGDSKGDSEDEEHKG